MFLLACALCACAALSAAQDAPNPFLQPGPGVEANDYSSASDHVVGSRYAIKWSYIEATNITLRIVVDVTNRQWTLLDHIEPGTLAYDWTVARPPNTNGNNVFFMSLANTQGVFYNSAYFNITDGATATISPTFTPMSTSTVPIATSTNTSGSLHKGDQGSANGTDTSTKLPVGAQAGIGVAISLISLLAVAGLVAYCMRRRRKQMTYISPPVAHDRPMQPYQTTPSASTVSDTPSKREHDGSALPDHTSPTELSCNRPAVELASHRWTTHARTLPRQ